MWATFGTTNLDWRSFLHNYELNAVALGAEFGDQVRTMFDADLAASDAVTPEQWSRRQRDLRVLSREFQNKFCARVSLDLLEILVTIKVVLIRFIEKAQR